MNPPLKIAIYVPTGKYTHIDNADNGNDCNCKCYKCGELLTARQGEKNTSHFSHRINFSCTGGSPEKLLHKLAKQIILDNAEIVTAKDEKLNYTNPIKETSLQTIFPDNILISKGKEIIPDIAIISNGKKIFFEIWVTNPKGADHKKAYRDYKLRCIEIDLNKIPFDSAYEEIKFAVLNDYTNKTEIGWVKEQPEIKEKSIWELILPIGFIIAVIFCIYKIFKRK